MEWGTWILDKGRHDVLGKLNRTAWHWRNSRAEMPMPQNIFEQYVLYYNGTEYGDEQLEIVSNKKQTVYEAGREKGNLPVQFIYELLNDGKPLFGITKYQKRTGMLNPYMKYSYTNHLLKMRWERGQEGANGRGYTRRYKPKPKRRKMQRRKRPMHY